MPDDRVKLTVRLPRETHEVMVRWTHEAGVSMNSALCALLVTITDVWEEAGESEPGTTAFPPDIFAGVVGLARQLDRERRGRASE